MKRLREKIKNEGIVEPNGILRVDSFLNHRLDIEFLNEVGLKFNHIFRDRDVDLILTMESSGIAIATITAQYLHKPVVFAKKSNHVNLPDELYVEEVQSRTQEKKNQLFVAKRFLTEGQRVLILDDFLAKGHAMHALASMVKRAGGEVVGMGVVIEKAFEGGGSILRNEGYDVVSLVKIATLDGGIAFVE